MVLISLKVEVSLSTEYYYTTYKIFQKMVGWGGCYKKRERQGVDPSEIYSPACGTRAKEGLGTRQHVEKVCGQRHVSMSMPREATSEMSHPPLAARSVLHGSAMLAGGVPWRCHVG